MQTLRKLPTTDPSTNTTMPMNHSGISLGSSMARHSTINLLLQRAAHHFEGSFSSRPNLKRASALLQQHLESIGRTRALFFHRLHEGGYRRPVNHVHEQCRL